MPADSLEQVVSLCKRRGFVFPGSAVYGGLANSWDYGPLGVELKNNVKKAWWQANVYFRDDMEGLDAALIMNRKVWKYSGHEATFNDPLIDNKKTGKRFRLDHLLEDQDDTVLQAVCAAMDLGESEREECNDRGTMLAVILRKANHAIEAGTSSAIGAAISAAKVIDPSSGQAGDWTEPRLFNLMFETYVGPIKDEDNKAYLRPETAQGIFANFHHVLDTMRRKLPFGIAQVGKSFRNEITPGNFTFRTREFEQMEIEYFVKPGEDDESHARWVEARWNWYLELGLAEERLTRRDQTIDELAHYAKACVDIEYRFPGSLGFAELEGIANRTDYDLCMHSKTTDNTRDAQARHGIDGNPDSVEELTYFDPTSKERFVPYVIEPSAGADRATLAFLCEAFAIEAVGEVKEEDAKKLIEQLEAFLKSVDKNADLSDEKKLAMAEYGKAILDEGSSAFPRISALLAMPGADEIALGKKLRGAADRVIDANFRTVLKLHPALSPIKIAIFPLKKNHEGIVQKARNIKRALARDFRVVYDDTGAIGKLYRRQDEIGTPFCVTVDFDSLEDDTVTVRSRDTMEQTRVPVAELREFFASRLAWEPSSTVTGGE